jgi:hypothetical protein
MSSRVGERGRIWNTLNPVNAGWVVGLTKDFSLQADLHHDVVSRGDYESSLFYGILSR